MLGHLFADSMLGLFLLLLLFFIYSPGFYQVLTISPVYTDH